MQKLVSPEQLLLLVLLPEGAAPHVDPAKVDKCALVALTLLYKGRLAVIGSKLHRGFLLICDCSVTVFVLLLRLGVASPLKLIHQGRVERRHDAVTDSNLRQT